MLMSVPLMYCQDRRLSDGGPLRHQDVASASPGGDPSTCHRRPASRQGTEHRAQLIFPLSDYKEAVPEKM